MPPLLESRSAGQVAFESSTAAAQLIVSIFGNFLLLIALYRKPRLSSATNIFIASLAATDLLNACIPGTVFLSSLLTSELWVGQVGCQVGGFFFFYLNILSAMTMALTAVSRYFCILKPNTCKTIFSFRRSVLFLAALWLIDAVVVGFPIVFGLATFELKALVSLCIIVFYDNAQQKAYTSAIMLTMNAFVITTLTFCYYGISKYLRQHQVNMSTSSNSNLSVQEIKITKTLFILILVYLLLWIPTLILVILFRVVLPQEIPRQVVLAAPYLLFTSGAINPFIYGFTNGLLRKKVKNIFRRSQIQPLNNAGDKFRLGVKRFQQALPGENKALNVLEGQVKTDIVTNFAQ